jgi:hypothetical protein
MARGSGCCAGGPEDIKNHGWFGRMNWESVFRGEIQTPFIPEVRVPVLLLLL